MRVHLTIRTGNRKVGKIPVSTTAKDSCPDTCAWYNKGCYAKTGPLGIHWALLSRGLRGYSWAEFCNRIAALPIGQLWRHNQAGDLPGKNKRIAISLLRKLVLANLGKRGFTYTHKPVLGSKYRANKKAIKQANKKGFTINLSADNMAQADKLYDLNIGPVTCVVPFDAPQKQLTPKGRTVVVCPAQYADITCADCQLCAKVDRKAIIGFLAHGAAYKSVSRRASLNIVE